MPRFFPALFCCFALALLALLAGCRSEGGAARPGEAAAPDSSHSGTLTVFAAASLADAFEAIGAPFEAAHPGARVVFNVAGSQQLAQQLALGAPGDVFASANAQQMQIAVAAGRVAPDAPQTFARNRLVAVVPEDNPGKLKALKDLARPGLKVVLAAEEVPAGRYARRFLEKASQDATYEADFARRVRANVVSNEQDVRAVLTKVVLGEADAGIVYSSDVVGADGGRVRRLPIPDALNVAARYPIAPLRDAPHPALAEAFTAFVRSVQGQQLLARYGFVPLDAP